jgi:hypothetical protein
MTPEEFHYFNKLNNHEYMQEIRVRSLGWMLDCYNNGTIRKRTIKQLIPKESLVSLLKEMEEVERYEDCITIKEILDTIYNPLNFNENEPMSKKRQKEIIKLLEATLLEESTKPNGGNSDTVSALTKKLEKVKLWEKKKDE